VQRLVSRRRRFDAAQLADVTLAARHAITSFEEEVASLLLRHAATVKRGKLVKTQCWPAGIAWMTPRSAAS
jgi:hypothetical protein